MALKMKMGWLTSRKNIYQLYTKTSNVSRISRHANHTFETAEVTSDENTRNSSNEQLYSGHIPTTSFQKCLLAVGSAFMSITDPYRHDMIAVLGEVTGKRVFDSILQKMVNDNEGKEILKDRPHISSATVDLDHLRTLSPDTLGAIYISFLDKEGVTPDTRMAVQFVDDPTHAYVVQRYREVHDLLHAVLGMPTNMLGEVAIKWVEAIQTGLPMCYMGAIVGPIRLAPKQRKKYQQLYLPWALRTGSTSKFLMNVYYEKRWEQNIYDLRKELRIDDLPNQKT